jgi:hypothetical protein
MESKKTHTVNGVFRGVDDDYYLFLDDEGENLEFDLCADDVLPKFNLNGTKEVGEYFTITYRINDEDEHEEVELEIINLKKC